MRHSDDGQQLVIDRVLVVVPAADEQDHIVPCLDAIALAEREAVRSVPGLAVRVVVVLDDCHDATERLLAGYDLDAVAVCERNVGAARRAGIAHGSAHWPDAGRLWLANTDADSVVPPDWLTAMVGFARSGDQVVLGTVVPGDGLDATVRGRWYEAHDLLDGHDHVHGANLGIRADCYEALGGFAPMPTGEDVDLARRAALAGLQVRRTAAIPVLTSARTTGRATDGFADYLDELSRTGAQACA